MPIARFPPGRGRRCAVNHKSAKSIRILIMRMFEGAAKIKARMINVSKERRWFRCVEPPIAPSKGLKMGTAGGST